MLDYAAVFFVRRTKDGVLARRLRQREEELAPIIGNKVKIVETTGRSIKSMLWCADPWGGSQCTDNTCPVCCHADNMGKSLCKANNVVYRNVCLLCKEEGKRGLYLGESSCNKGERAQK